MKRACGVGALPHLIKDQTPRDMYKERKQHV
jgi:hypothetical protein